MNALILDDLKAELMARGFSPGGTAPNDTMSVDDGYLADIELADLFDTMITRREKVARSIEVVGVDAARASFDDVVAVVDAIKAVMAKLVLP